MIAKIMTVDSLDSHMARLDGCRAVLDVIHANLANGENCPDALYGACDLLESICRDFQAVIDTAENYTGETG